MRNSLDHAPDRPDDEENDSLPSIYDRADGEAPRRPAPPAAPRAGAGNEPAEGLAALGAAAALGRAEARLARLDERLAASPFCADAVARVALEEAAALARLHGWRGGAGRLGRLAFDRAGLDAEGDVRALWIWRELARPEPDRIATADPAALAARISAGGSGALDAAEAADALHGAPAPAMPAAERRDRAARWLAAAAATAAALPALGPVTCGAALFAAWTAEPGAARPVGAVLAMRFAPGRDLRALPFLPLAVPGRDRAFGPAASLPDRVALWAAAAGDAAAAHLLRLDRLAAWRDAAEGRVRSRLGLRLLPLLHAAPLVESAGLARRLRVTPQYVNRALQALAAAGLVEETTGGDKYRLWRARLGGG